MIWVYFDHTVKYGGEYYPPYKKFRAKDEDSELLVKEGGVISGALKRIRKAESDAETSEVTV